MGSCCCVTRRASHALAMASDAGHHPQFWRFRAFGVVFGHSQLFLLMCLIVVLTHKSTGTSFDLD